MSDFEYRVGLGHDTHRLGPDRPLILGGVRVDYDRGLVGHSDADVLLHAVTDALLGAAALGDIGELFPDTDPANKDLDSRIFLEAALTRVRQLGWEPVNLDCTLFAQRPKLSGYKPTIAQHLAQLLDGIPRAGRYQEAGRFQSDPIVLIGISPWVDDTRGVLAQIAGDSLSGEVPLLGVRLDATEDFCEVIEDYRWWWGHHRPTEARLTPSPGNQSTVPLTRSWIADSFTPDEI